MPLTRRHLLCCDSEPSEAKKSSVKAARSAAAAGIGVALGVVSAACSDPITVEAVNQQRPPVVEDVPVEPGLDLSFGIALTDPAEVTTDALAVHFLQPPGFYEAPPLLEIEGADPKAEIIYTLDGSLPDRSAIEEPAAPPEFDGVVRRHTYRYSGPIDLAPWFERANQLSLIDTGTRRGHRGWRAWRKPTEAVAKAVVVRAQAIADDLVSPLESGTYFSDRRGRERYSLPVVSISTEAAYLFNSRIGLYVQGEDAEQPNFAQHGDDWERPAYFEWFDLVGDRPVSQWLGVRIQGNYTRAFPQKSLRLLARKEYGRSALEYPFFATKSDAEFKRLVLRNGGNDWEAAHFRDAATQSLVQHLPLETQHAQPAVVFINGEYWGLHDLRDRLDKFHLELRHGVPRDQIAILKNNATLAEGTEADVDQYREFVGALLDGDFDTWDEVDQHVAISEFLDYVILESYAGNTDWPGNNFAYWRYNGAGRSEGRGPRDGRWRPLVFDIDRSFGANGSTDADVVSLAFGDNPKIGAARIFRGMIAVKEIRHEFIQRMAIHLATTFESSRVSGVISRFTRAIEAEMPEQIARWGYPASMDEFYGHVEDSHEFADARPAIVRRDVDAFFDDVSGVAKVRIENIDPARPPTLHGIRLSSETPGVKLEDGVWQAQVFAGVPLVLTADGVNWSGSSVKGATVIGSQDRLELTLEPNAKVTIRLPVASNVDSDD